MQEWNWVLLHVLLHLNHLSLNWQGLCDDTALHCNASTTAINMIIQNLYWSSDLWCDLSGISLTPKKILKGYFTKKWRLPHDLLTLKPSYVYMTFIFQTNTIRVIFKNVLTLPNFIMAVDGCYFVWGTFYYGWMHFFWTIKQFLY